MMKIRLAQKYRMKKAKNKNKRIDMKTLSFRKYLKIMKILNIKANIKHCTKINHYTNNVNFTGSNFLSKLLKFLLVYESQN